MAEGWVCVQGVRARGWEEERWGVEEAVLVEEEE